MTSVENPPADVSSALETAESMRREQERRINTVAEVANVDKGMARAVLDAHSWNLEASILHCVSQSFDSVVHHESSIILEEQNPSEPMSPPEFDTPPDPDLCRQHPHVILTPQDDEIKPPPKPINFNITGRASSSSSRPPLVTALGIPSVPVHPPPPSHGKVELPDNNLCSTHALEMFPLMDAEVVEEVIERHNGSHEKAIEELLWRNQDEEDEYPGDGPETVFLNVYNLAPDSSLDKLGVGVFHSGLEVYGREWGFGGASSQEIAPEATGVFWVVPQTATPNMFKQIELGKTTLSHREVWKTVVNPAKGTWRVSDYHLIQRNCNHFASFMAKQLGVKSPPAWVNRAARWGEAVVPSKIIRYLLKDTSTPSSSSSISSSSSSGNPEPPKTARSSSNVKKSKFGSFSTKKRAKDDADT